MSLITKDIPAQGFEIVRDAIAAILKIELESQKVKKNLQDDINVYVGRSVPFQHSERLMFNVMLDSANYSNNNESGTHGFTNYFIDIYVSSKQKNGETGGFTSTKKRDFYLGMIRYILSDHHYKTLNLDLGMIMGTSVQGFENFESTNQKDAGFVKMTRLNFGVRINEFQSLWEGININTIFTDVKLNLTNKGYNYETIVV